MNIKDFKYFVRIRGLPFNVHTYELKVFISLESIKEDDFAFSFDVDGRFLGEVYLRLRTESDFEHVKKLDKEKFG